MKNKQTIRCLDCQFCDTNTAQCKDAIIIEDHDLTNKEIYNFRKKDCDGYIKRKRV